MLMLVDAHTHTEIHTQTQVYARTRASTHTHTHMHPQWDMCVPSQFFNLEWYIYPVAKTNRPEAQGTRIVITTSQHTPKQAGHITAFSSLTSTRRLRIQ